jgi:hypothetical protein
MKIVYLDDIERLMNELVSEVNETIKNPTETTNSELAKKYETVIDAIAATAVEKPTTSERAFLDANFVNKQLCFAPISRRLANGHLDIFVDEVEWNLRYFKDNSITLIKPTEEDKWVEVECDAVEKAYICPKCYFEDKQTWEYNIHKFSATHDGLVFRPSNFCPRCGQIMKKEVYTGKI